MLPRELVEELVGWRASTGLHVLVPLANAFERFLTVLALPFEVVGQEVIKGLSSALPAPTGQLLELHQTFGLYWQRFHIALYNKNQYPMGYFHAHCGTWGRVARKECARCRVLAPGKVVV